ncbi:unnamed protein product [Heligmosomoides polygyrus]|uniref:DUF148 domain-containing protein n=1 Tax=Heligmosomoides polygyrus TaxID=6339 RepID=A0A183FAG6_HELPZ|nr:unnamed protein product [Heligmosomoides polygyrus]
MNSAVFILAIVGAVLCGPGGDNGRGGRGGPGARGGPGGHHGGPPFLQNVTDEARQEFFSILHNKNETTEQHKAELLTWAEKYGILDQVQPFAANLTDFGGHRGKHNQTPSPW